LNELKNFYSAASAVFAVMPGMTILLSNVGVPPNTSKVLFAGITESLGVITIMILWLNKQKFKTLTNRSVTRLCLISLSIFLIAICSYFFLFALLIVPVNNSEALYFPLWPAGELKESLQQFGSKAELIRQWGRDDVYKVIQSSSTIALQFTTLILLIIYQLIFVSLTFSFGILGIKSSGKKQVKSNK
jgi:hypothetical protein